MTPDHTEAPLTPETPDLEGTLEFLHSLLMTVQEGIVACDARGEIQFFNGVTRKMHGLSPWSIPARSCSDHYQLCSVETLQPLAEHDTPLARTLRGETVEGDEMLIQPVHGETRHVSCYGRQIKNESGKVLGAVVTLLDLTGEKHLEEDLQQSQHLGQWEQHLRVASERSLKQSRVLQNITQRLFDLTSTEDLARVILEESQPLLPIKTVSIFLKQVEAGQLLVTSQDGLQPEVVQALSGMPLNAQVPHTEVARSGQAQFHPRIRQLQDLYPELSWLEETLEGASLAFLPIKLSSETTGTLVLQLEEKAHFRTNEQLFMETLADQVALAIERLRLHHREKLHLQEQEETIARLKAILDHAPLGIALRGLDLDLQLANQSYSQYEAELQATDAQLQQVLETGEPLLGVQVHPADGSSQNLLLNHFPVKTQDGRLLGVGSTVQDISEQRQVVHLSDTAHSKTVYANGHLHDTLGYSPEEVQRMSPEQLKQLLHAEESQEAEEHQQTLAGLADGVILERDFRMRHKDGSWRWMHSRHKVFSRDDHQKPLLVLTGTLDVTDRKAAELALQSSAQELRELNEAQKRFVADAAHELKNPLTSIQGNMDLMIRYRGIPEPDRLEMISDVQKEAIRLGRLVNDMLQLARGDSGELFREEEVQLDEVLLEGVKVA
ncbi:PAS domain S-box protein [Deinococcus cellulosilyticus]|uniref:PAS domain S-box protein n=2 Tax=Deinococcus cellulosilyticus TaxID=401558 RepID=UPI003618B5E2